MKYRIYVCRNIYKMKKKSDKIFVYTFICIKLKITEIF